MIFSMVDPIIEHENWIELLMNIHIRFILNIHIWMKFFEILRVSDFIKNGIFEDQNHFELSWNMAITQSLTPLFQPVP